jgi:hypothetical protein
VTNVDAGSSGSSAEIAVLVVVGGCFGCNDNDAILELVKANDGILSNTSVKIVLKRAIMLFLSCERHAYGF